MPLTHPQPDGYLAVPPSDKGQAVLVLHAWWGLNDTTREFCRQLANSGYLSFAPDLYHGKVTTKIPEAEVFSNELFGKSDQAKKDISDATSYLIEQSDQVEIEVAVIGFSLGAYFALEASVSDPEHIRSVITYYGTRPGDYSPSKAAYLGHFAETDEFEPRANVDELEEALRRAGRPVTFYHYDNTGHWFCEPDRSQAYKQEAANLAWKRSLAFLKRPSGG
jgi:carboxymethylenebutenolidase